MQLLLTLALVLVRVVLWHRRDPLQHFPAFNPLARYTNLAFYLLLDRRAPGPSILLSSHLAESPVIRTGPRHLTLRSLPLSSQRWNEKPASYAAFDIEGHSIIFSSRAKPERAKHVARIFSAANVKDRESLIAAAVAKACDKAPGQTNLLALFRAFAIDVGSEVAFGKSIGALDSDQDFVGITHDGFNKAVPRALFMATAARWEKAVLRVYERATGYSEQHTPEEEQAMERYFAYVDSVVDAPPPDSYAALLGIEDRSALIAEVSDLLFAATESLATTLSLTLLHLYQPQNAKWLQALRQGRGDIVSTTAKEGLRISAPVARAKDRIVSSLNGHALPPGTVVAVGQSTLHFDPAVFPDPHTFNPGRWNGSPDEFVPFGLRGRTCLGQPLALAQLEAMLTAFVSRLDIPSPPPPPQGRDYWNRGFDSPITAQIVPL